MSLFVKDHFVNRLSMFRPVEYELLFPVESAPSLRLIHVGTPLHSLQIAEVGQCDLNEFATSCIRSHEIFLYLPRIVDALDL